MRLIIVRHGIAVNRETAEMEDEERPLTRRGIRRFRSAAAGLARIERRPDHLLSSPLVRARQTADILSRAWGKVKVTEEEALADSAATILSALAKLDREATVAIVGHEPDLSQVLAILVGSEQGNRFTFKKGGAACVSIPGEVGAGGGLVWYLPPRLLRRLAG